MEAILYQITLWSFFAGMAAHFAQAATVERGRAWRALVAVAVILIAVGFAALTGSIAWRWSVQGRVPISSSYEYLSVLAWFLALFYFIVMARVRRPFLGVTIAPGLFLAIVFAGLYPRRLEMTLVPALQSYWLKIHVSMTIIGEAAFALAFVMGVLYLLKAWRREELEPGAGALAFYLFPGCLGVGMLAVLLLRSGGLVLDQVRGPALIASLIGGGFLVAVPLYLLAWRRWLSRARTGGFGGVVFALAVLALLAGGMLLASLVNRDRRELEGLIGQIQATDRLITAAGEGGTLEAGRWAQLDAAQQLRLETFRRLEALQAERKTALTREEAAPLLTDPVLAAELSFPLSLGEIREQRHGLEQELADLEGVVTSIGLPARAEALQSYRQGLVSRYNGYFSGALLPPEQGRESTFLGYMVLLAVPLFTLLYWLIPRVRPRLPEPEALDSLAYRAVSLGFPVFTFGALIAGAIWAHYAWGKWWSNDPKEVGSLIVWLVFLVYLHARQVRRWSGGQAAVAAILGFLFAILSFVGNSVLGGLHSYG